MTASPQRSEEAWLHTARMHVLQRELPAAQAAVSEALDSYPNSIELRRVQAGILEKCGDLPGAEALLRLLLAGNPGDAASAFALARLLKAQGRMAAVAAIMRACFKDISNRHDADLTINAIELLDDCGRKSDATALAETAVAEHPDDMRLRAYAGMQIQLGEFDRARQHYLFALAHDERAWEWHVPIGLSTTLRYTNREQPDFALFRTGLQREGLSTLARAELYFALGKAHDDIGEYELAACHFRQGNALAHRLTRWQRAQWEEAVKARLAARPPTHRAKLGDDFRMVFIVGMPRSGTTLLAELLSRHPLVCNRGESPWIAELAGQPWLNGGHDCKSLQRAAAVYTAQVRQDDAPSARWFVDKQPLNLRYVDLILALFPNAKIIHCTRGARDTALSLWMQCFLEDVQGYAYDFTDIALVMRDCDSLMKQWRHRYPESIRSIRYEKLVADEHAVTTELANWIGLPPGMSRAASGVSTSAISTASLWQARQPVNSRSIDRWRSYAPYVPEMLDLFES